ncbi:MAG: hypothetical protein P4L36_08905 [Holophaga sp.]|nr:hypothetical protein [Holophaga sp.]
MKFQTLTEADILGRMEESIRDVEARYTPDTPPRLKLGRPCKARGRQRSRMKGVRLDVDFLAQLEARLEQEQLSFSGLVQTLLGAWMAATPARPPAKSVVP